MTPAVTFAIQEARRIRRNLIYNTGDTSLVGQCALASLLLAEVLGGPATLRHTTGHVWNAVNDVIIDITATQFNRISDIDICGVLVTTTAMYYHKPVIGRGMGTLRCLADGSWHVVDEETAFSALIERVRSGSRGPIKTFHQPLRHLPVSAKDRAELLKLAQCKLPKRRTKKR